MLPTLVSSRVPPSLADARTAQVSSVVLRAHTPLETSQLSTMYYCSTSPPRTLATLPSTVPTKQGNTRHLPAVVRPSPVAVVLAVFGDAVLVAVAGTSRGRRCVVLLVWRLLLLILVVVPREAKLRESGSKRFVDGQHHSHKKLLRKVGEHTHACPNVGEKVPQDPRQEGLKLGAATVERLLICRTERVWWGVVRSPILILSLLSISMSSRPLLNLSSAGSASRKCLGCQPAGVRSSKYHSCSSAGEDRFWTLRKHQKRHPEVEDDFGSSERYALRRKGRVLPERCTRNPRLAGKGRERHRDGFKRATIQNPELILMKGRTAVHGNGPPCPASRSSERYTRGET